MYACAEGPADDLLVVWAERYELDSSTDLSWPKLTGTYIMHLTMTMLYIHRFNLMARRWEKNSQISKSPRLSEFSGGHVSAYP